MPVTAPSLDGQRCSLVAAFLFGAKMKEKQKREASEAFKRAAMFGTVAGRARVEGTSTTKKRINDEKQ
jgi:hypothetical protein